MSLSSRMKQSVNDVWKDTVEETESALVQVRRIHASRRRRHLLVATVAIAGLSAIVLTIAPSLLASLESPNGTNDDKIPQRPAVAAEGRWSRIEKYRDPSRESRGLPTGLQNLTSFWTGDRALIVAGSSYDESVKGALYTPTKDVWETISDAPIESRVSYSAVWTGDQMLIWGGTGKGGELADGAAYEIRGDAWSLLEDAPLGPRFHHSAVWTGEEMIVWGGTNENGELTDDGAAYDPGSRTWRPIADSPLAGRFGHIAVWTGEEMIVWGGMDDWETVIRSGSPELLTDGASYDPSTDSWSEMSESPLNPSVRQAGVWTGQELLVTDAGGGAAYDPNSDGWRRLPDSPLSPREGPSVVWTGEEMIVWGGSLNDGAMYRTSSNDWQRVSDSPLSPRDRHTALWTGEEMIVWGGCCSGDRYLIDGGSFRPPP